MKKHPDIMLSMTTKPKLGAVRMRLVEIMNRSRLVLFLLIFVVPCQSVKSQVGINLSLYGLYYSNSFENYQVLPDRVSQLFLEAQRDFEGEHSNINVTYRGNVNLFREFSDRNSHEHAAFFNYALRLNPPDEDEEESDSAETEEQDNEPPEAALTATIGDSLNSYLLVGANVGGRFDRVVYNYHDNASAGVYAGLKCPVSDNFIGRVQNNLSYRNYSNLQEMSNWQDVVSLALGKYFDSGTGLILEASYGYKKYLSTLADTTRIAGKKTGKGKGSGSQNRQDKVIIKKYDTPGASQLIVALGMVQQVTAKTMIGLKYLLRTNPSDNAHYIAGQSRDFIPSDEIYDDQYTYRGNELGLLLKQELPWKTTMQVLGNRFIKRYQSPAFDVGGNELSDSRHDTKWEISVGLTKSLSIESGFLQGITLELNYQYCRNQSNDEYNDFFNHTVSFGIGADF
jgi:hypothetical protein